VLPPLFGVPQRQSALPLVLPRPGAAPVAALAEAGEIWSTAVSLITTDSPAFEHAIDRCVGRTVIDAADILHTWLLTDFRW